MVSRDEGRHVLWPEYFDSSLSRGDGRRVSEKWAIKDPNIEDIAKVAEALDLNPMIEEEFRYPSSPRARGRVLVDASQPKTTTIRIISKRLHTGKY